MVDLLLHSHLFERGVGQVEQNRDRSSHTLHVLNKELFSLERLTKYNVIICTHCSARRFVLDLIRPATCSKRIAWAR